MRRSRRVTMIILFGIILMGMTGCGASSEASSGTSSDKTELLVSAAASLADCLTDIAAIYEQSHSDVTVYLNIGSSGSLRQQIEQGAAADLFLSADERNMQLLTDRQWIDASHQTALLSNQLVVVAPVDRDMQIEAVDELLEGKFTHIALGDPTTVPSGSYAREALEKMDLWGPFEEIAVYGNNVRQVLAYVETGNADAGFVYKTDALGSNKVRTVYTFDSSIVGEIRYYAGIIRDSGHMEEAEAFYQYLQGPEAREIFERYGFGVMDRQ